MDNPILQEREMRYTASVVIPACGPGEYLCMTLAVSIRPDGENVMCVSVNGHTIPDFLANKKDLWDTTPDIAAAAAALLDRIPVAEFDHMIRAHFDTHYAWPLRLFFGENNDPYGRATTLQDIADLLNSQPEDFEPGSVDAKQLAHAFERIGADTEPADCIATTATQKLVITENNRAPYRVVPAV